MAKTYRLGSAIAVVYANLDYIAQPFVKPKN